MIRRSHNLGGRPDRFGLSALFVLIIFSAAIAQPDTLWTTMIDSPIYSEVYMIPTRDGGYAFGGGVIPEGKDDRDLALMKVDSAGSYEWLHTYYEVRPDSVPWYEQARAVKQTQDGGFFLVNSEHLTVAVKTDSFGRLQWLHNYSDDEITSATGAIVADNGNILVVNYSNVFMLDVEDRGEILWERDFANLGGTFICVAKAEDGGYLLAGRIGRRGAGSSDFYAARIDSEGEFVWDNTYGTANYELCMGVTAMSDGGWTLVGDCLPINTREHNPMIVRIDAEGGEIWRQIVVEEPRPFSYLRSSVETRDGGVAAVGEGYRRPGDRSDQDALLIRTSAEGELLWKVYYDGDSNTEGAESIVLLEDNGFMLGGFSDGAWMIRTEPDPSINSVTLLKPAFPSRFSFSPPYPNPFNSAVQLSYSLPRPSQTSIRIYDQLGKQVAELYNGRLQAGQHNAIWTAEDVSAGLYFCKVVAGHETATAKVMQVR